MTTIKLRELPVGTWVYGRTANGVYYEIVARGDGLFDVESSYEGLHKPLRGEVLGLGHQHVDLSSWLQSLGSAFNVCNAAACNSYAASA